MANRELETIDEDIRKEKEKYVESTSKTIKHKSKKASSLLRAAHKGKESKIVALLTKEGIDINCKDVEREETPLHYAATAGHNTVVDYLLVKGANVNLANAKGQNAVHKAAYFDSHEIIRTLSNYGADLNAEDSEGMTPLFFALSRNAHNSVASLIQCGADFKLCGGKSKTLIALHEASSRGFVKAVKAICERCEPDYINLQNPVGNTALHIAVLNSRTGVIALLLGYKISTQIRNSNGFTAADLALTSGFHEIASVIAKSAEQKSSTAPPPSPAEVVSVQQSSHACQGYMLILSENKKKWAKHYFQIRDGLLFEYERQGGEQVNVHNLFGSTLQLLQNANLPYCFEVSSASTSRLILKAFTNEELTNWTKDIQTHANPEKTLKASKVTNRLSATNNQTVDSEIRKYNESMTKATISANTWDAILQKFSTHAQSLEVEYEWILLEEREMSKSQTLCSDAMLPNNRKKNRYNNFLPYNSTRVPLSEIPGVEGSDYINANYITFESNTFVATQAPLPHTVEDFYKMIWEHCSPAIVMLTPFSEGSRNTAHDYLPKPNRPLEMETYPIRISLLEQQTFPFYTLSILNFELLQKTGQDDTFVVKHFHCNNWHENQVIDITALLEMVEQVRGVAKAHPEFPITVHCSSGMSQTGVWIFVSGYLQRFETCLTDNSVPTLNIMQAVELLRSQRTGLLTHMDQYQFIYHFVLSQLELIGRRKNSRDQAPPPPLWPPSEDTLPDLPAPPPEPVEFFSIPPPLATAVPAATMRRSIMISNSPNSGRKSLRMEPIPVPAPQGSVSKKTSAVFGVKASEPARPSVVPRSNTVTAPPSLPSRDDPVPILPAREEPPLLVRKPSNAHILNPPPILPVREDPTPTLPPREDPPAPVLPPRGGSFLEESKPAINRPPSQTQLRSSNQRSFREERTVSTPPPIESNSPSLPPRDDSSRPMKPIPHIQPVGTAKSPSLPPREEPPPLTRAPSDGKLQQAPPPTPAREEPPQPRLVKKPSETRIQPPVSPRDEPQQVPSKITRAPSDNKIPVTPPREEPKPPFKEEPPWKLNKPPPATPPREEPASNKFPATSPREDPKPPSNKPPPATPPRDEPAQPPLITRATSDSKIQQPPPTPAREEPPQPRFNKTASMDRREDPQPRLNKTASIDRPVLTREDSQSRLNKAPPPTPTREEPPRLSRQPSSSDMNRPPSTPPRDDTSAKAPDPRISRIPSDNKLTPPPEKQTKPPVDTKTQPSTPSKQNSFTVQSNPFLTKDKGTQPPAPKPAPQPKVEEPKQPAAPVPVQPSPSPSTTKAPAQTQTTKQEFSLLEWLKAIEMEHLVGPLTELGADTLKNLEVLTADDLGEVPNLKPLEKKRLMMEIGKLLQAK